MHHTTCDQKRYVLQWFVVWRLMGCTQSATPPIHILLTCTEACSVHQCCRATIIPNCDADCITTFCRAPFVFTMKTSTFELWTFAQSPISYIRVRHGQQLCLPCWHACYRFCCWRLLCRAWWLTQSGHSGQLLKWWQPVWRLQRQRTWRRGRAALAQLLVDIGTPIVALLRMPDSIKRRRSTLAALSCRSTTSS